MTGPIYPEVNFILGYREFTLATFIRKEYKGVYYLQAVKDWYIYHLNSRGRPIMPDTQTRDKFIGSFYRNVYMVMICGIIDPNIVSPIDGPLFIKDPDQRTELERLLNK